MSKELTPLEAYKHAKWCVNTIKINKKIGSETIRNEENDSLCDTIDECLDIIKTALKDYERLLKMRKTAEWADEKLQTKKKIKALAIIKKKSVNVDRFFMLAEDLPRKKALSQYNKWVEMWQRLTKEEFDLLKEVLL